MSKRHRPAPRQGKLQFVLSERLKRPQSRQELADWITRHARLLLPLEPMCAHHQTPLDFLEHSFLEQGRPGDAIVWACRGGGKTMIGAVATLLDLLFKPGIQIRILAGSLEQADRMYGYLRGLFSPTGLFAEMVQGVPTRRRLALHNGSVVEVLAQSDRSVRGQRVQKLRCDEVELFQPEVWAAAQLATRSLGPESDDALPYIHSAIEAFSTMHKPGGLMQQLIANDTASEGRRAARSRGQRKVFAWCVWDIVARCHATRSCSTCSLLADCQGRAKNAVGFMAVDDLLAMQGRVSRMTWEHEMLCHPPRFEDAVFASFRREVHVRAMNLEQRCAGAGAVIAVDGRTCRVETLIAGVDFGFAHAFVCLWILMLRDEGGRRIAWVSQELVSQQKTLEWNINAMRERGGDARPGSANGPPAIVYADIAGAHTNSQSGKSDLRLIREAGFTVRAATMAIDDGVEMIQTLLEPAAGPARLFVDPCCKRLMAALEGYRRGSDNRPIKDGEHDHLIDALRYALFNHDRPAGALETRHY